MKRVVINSSVCRRLNYFTGIQRWIVTVIFIMWVVNLIGFNFYFTLAVTLLYALLPVLARTHLRKRFLISMWLFVVKLSWKKGLKLIFLFSHGGTDTDKTKEQTYFCAVMSHKQSRISLTKSSRHTQAISDLQQMKDGDQFFFPSIFRSASCIFQTILDTR